MRTSFHLVIAFAGVLATSLAIGAVKVSADHVVVELVSESASLKAGARAWLGLKFAHEPRWHTYWVNPGDSGLPTRLEWQLPPGFKALDPEWPAPKRIAYGDLYNFGYEDAMLLPIPIDVPANASGDVTLTVNARWLICNDVCIPGKAVLSIRTPVTKADAPKNAALAPLFVDARAARPVSATAQGRITENEDLITIELRGANLPEGEFDAFPASQRLFMNTPFKITRAKDSLTLVGERSEYFESAPETLSLVVTRVSPAKGSPSAWQFDIPWLAPKMPLANSDTSH